MFQNNDSGTPLTSITVHVLEAADCQRGPNERSHRTHVSTRRPATSEQMRKRSRKIVSNSTTRAWSCRSTVVTANSLGTSINPNASMHSGRQSCEGRGLSVDLASKMRRRTLSTL